MLRLAVSCTCVWSRTEPSVGSLLGCKADILQLDVTDVLHKGEEAGSGRLRIG